MELFLPKDMQTNLQIRPVIVPPTILKPSYYSDNVGLVWLFRLNQDFMQILYMMTLKCPVSATKIFCNFNFHKIEFQQLFKEFLLL